MKNLNLAFLLLFIYSQSAFSETKDQPRYDLKANLVKSASQSDCPDIDKISIDEYSEGAHSSGALHFYSKGIEQTQPMNFSSFIDESISDVGATLGLSYDQPKTHFSVRVLYPTANYENRQITGPLETMTFYSPTQCLYSLRK